MNVGFSILKLLGVVLLVHVEAAHDGLRQLARLEAVHDLALGGRRAALAVDGGELVRVAGKVACRRCWRGCPVQTKRVDWLIAFG